MFVLVGLLKAEYRPLKKNGGGGEGGVRREGGARVGGGVKMKLLCRKILSVVKLGKVKNGFLLGDHFNMTSSWLGGWVV